MAIRHRRGLDADDLAHEIVVHLLPVVDDVMRRYTDPIRYARVRFPHATVSYDRTQRAQRSERARLVVDTDGHQRIGRAWMSGDAAGPDGASPVFTTVRDPGPGPEATVVDRISTVDALADCLSDLSVGDRTVLFAADGLGLPIEEIARVRGVRRETVSRHVNSVRRRAARRGEFVRTTEVVR